MKVTTPNVRLRAEPSTNSPILATLNPDTIVVQVDRPWLHIKVDNVEGWAALEFLTDYTLTQPSDSPEETTYTLDELLPLLTDSFPYKVLAAIAKQESGFKNYRVHFDGTGHGLFGLDDNGMLPSFEAFSKINVGRGHNAIIIPIKPQIDFAKHILTIYSDKYDGPYNAARVWHRGEGQWQDTLGDNYEALIRHWEATLFP